MNPDNASEQMIAMELSNSQARLLSEVHVNVEVQLGEIELSVSQLIDLLPGQRFNFEFDSLRPLKLKISEEEIGEAVFVKHGDQLALEIVKTAGN
jgi:flagellar motor switch protein FliM